MSIENIESLIEDERERVHNMPSEINTGLTSDPDILPDQTPEYVDPDLEEGVVNGQGE